MRLANVYGPGMSEKNVMSTILSQIPGVGALKVMDTNPVRDFIWVEDAAEGIVALALGKLNEFDEKKVFNLGTGIGTSIGSLAELALEIGTQPSRQVKAQHLNSRKSILILDSSDTTNACGWISKTSLRQGLTQMLHIRQES